MLAAYLTKQPNNRGPQASIPNVSVARPLLASLLIAAFGISSYAGVLTSRSNESLPPHSQGTVVRVFTQTLGAGHAPALAQVFLLFQRERNPSARTAPQQNNAAQNCMQARSQMRRLGTFSLVGIILFAVVIYAILMSFAPRGIPPLAKWLLSPAFAAVIVALIVSYFEANQLANACGESGSFRLDTFLRMGILGFFLTLFIFTLWSVGLRLRGQKRLRIAAE